jgi:hypothetical protein
MKRLLLPLLAAAALRAAGSPVAPAINAFTIESYKHLASA